MPRRQQGYSPLDVIGSPIYNIFETVGNLPGVRDTSFADWLASDTFAGVQNFQADQPFAAGALDFASMLVPFVGWGGATARATTGALGAVNKASQAAARLAPRSPGTAFALGETVRYAPLSAAITGFDLAGQRYDSPIDALASFGLGTVGGAALQGVGHALIPAMRNVPMLGGAWKAVFEPGPQLSALYGFSDNMRRAAGVTAAQGVVQEAASPLLEPQLRAAALWDLIGEADRGMHPEVDVDLLRGQYDAEIRTILHEELDPADTGFRFAPDADDAPQVRSAVDSLLRMAPARGGERVRLPITSSNKGPTNPDELAKQLELPVGWIHDTKLPGITQTTWTSGTWLRREIGLEGSALGRNFRTLQRTTPTGQTQIWSVRQEQDGLYMMTTQVPGDHTMTGRARYPETQRLDKAEPARAFLSFKTPNPARFLPDLKLDIDNPAPGPNAWSFDDRIPRGESDFLDKAMDFRKLYLSPETIKANYKAMLSGKKGKERFTKEMLAGPTAGKEIANFVETYAAPTVQQLKNSPEGRSILGMYQALFDAAEGRKSRLLYGMANIPKDKNPITALFSAPDMDDANALVTQLRRTLQEDPEALELIRKFDKGQKIDLKSIEGTPAGKWLTQALKTNDVEVNAINSAIKALQKAGATDAKTIPERAKHFGLSRRWDGSNFYPIYKEGQIEPVAVVAGGSKSHAEIKAKEWIKNEQAANPGSKHRLGQPFVAGESDEVPSFIRLTSLHPGLLEPRVGIRGFENEFESYKHVDDFIQELEENYTRRWRYAASVIGDALSGGKLALLRNRDPHAFNIVNTRIAQMKGQPGPMERRMNQIVDSAVAKYTGTNSFSKASEAANELNFHLLHGAGNVATPLLNMTSVLQTQLPEAVNFLTSAPDSLRSMGYQFPVFGPDGLPRAGFNHVTDPIGLLWGAVREVSDPDPESLEVFNALFNKREMGSGLANEYTGQDRTIALRASEGIRGPEDFAFWAKKVSSLLMSKTEQISRTMAAGMSLRAMKMFEQSNGVKFTMDQKIHNALRMVQLSNYGYFAADRPMMFTTPLGALFGNQKTWMTNYLFMMGHYLGLAQKGNMAPLMFTLGTTTALGGVFAVPLLGAGIDAFTETFADQDAREFIYERMGEGGNGVSFGLPALFGMSLSGNVAAPGSNLAHDAEFFTTIVAFERAKLMGRALGRGWDDQVTLGMNPLKDELFRKQFVQAFAPRAVYRTMESLMDESLRSAATGYPLINEFGWGSRIMHSLGFRTTDIAIQYAAYEHLLKDRNAMRDKVSLFGDAYARASLEGNRQQMMEILQQAAVSGVDISSVMRSSQVRMRNAGYDMFGRNFTSEQLDRYQQTLETGGR